MNNNIIKYKGNTFYAIIHTVEVCIPAENANLADELDKQEYIKSAFYRNSRIWVILNINIYPNKSKSHIMCLSMFNKVFNEVLEKHGIRQYIIHRVDVAVSTIPLSIMVSTAVSWRENRPAGCTSTNWVVTR